MEALIEWIQRHRRPSPPTRPVPAFLMEELPPEMREEVGRHAGVRPLLRLAQTSQTLRDQVDRVFVFIFNRDISSALASPWKGREAQLTRAGVLRDPAGDEYSPQREAALPYVFLQLLFLPHPHYIYDLTEAHQQKLNLCAIYRTVCQKLALRFVFELELAYRHSIEEESPQEILWIDVAMPDRSFTARINPPSQSWLRLRTESVLTFEALGSVAPEVLPHLDTFRRLAPSVVRLTFDDAVCLAWKQAFMNLLLEVSTRFESFMKLPMAGGARPQRRVAGLSTLTLPVAMDIGPSSDS
jgi:hypothetical protein